jgi:hypothetical protein
VTAKLRSFAVSVGNDDFERLSPETGFVEVPGIEHSFV